MVLEVLTKIWFRFYLSILWVVCCIPVVTAGAATTAYCGMLLKMKYGEEGYVTKGFFGIFRKEWKQATKIWMVILLFFLILYCDSNYISYLVNHYGGWYHGLVPVYYFLLILVFAELLYVFPYEAMYQNTTKEILKNSFLIATRHWGITVTVMVLDLGMFFVVFKVFPGIIVIVPMVLGWVNVSLIHWVLKKYRGENS